MDDPAAEIDALKVAIKKRLDADGRWREVEPIRDEMMRECRRKGMSKEAAQAWTYSEVDRLYPPMAEPEQSGDEGQGNVTSAAPDSGETAPTDNPAHPREGWKIPADWPPLAPNASLAAEIAWVQAERLRVVEERGNSTVVRLDRARSPAPSWAALSWLETSIRSYAKYVEVAAKATSQQADEQAASRRERLAIDEVRALLEEMQA